MCWFRARFAPLAALATVSIGFVAACGGDGTTGPALDAALEAAPPPADVTTTPDEVLPESPDAGTPSDAAHLPPDAAPPDPVHFECRDDNCPELVVDGDPIDRGCFNFSPCFVRGMYDPTLEFDATTDTLWLGYTAGTAVLAERGNADTLAAAHRTHLARSDDHGLTFTFVDEVTPATPLTHPTTHRLGMVENEVSTLVHEPAGDWTLLWLRYFETAGPNPSRSDFVYARKVAATPPDLTAAPLEPYLRGNFPDALDDTPRVLSQEVPELADCLAFTEPALYTHDGLSYLASTCLVANAAGTAVDYTRSRNVLLRRDGESYSFVGTLLTHDDAVALGGDSLEQMALADSRVDGRTLLVATPIDHQAAVQHQGCVVLSLDDLETAHVARDADGRLQLRAVITATGGQLGPGLCDYDAASETGVLLTIPVEDRTKSPPDLRIAIHATGLHP